ncbi:hypothetical protein JXA85_06295 [Candidatus Woesearchaeota archaeon]|nr:hypothetical protein [Candidatus Woesearchaeota archaeon]
MASPLDVSLLKPFSIIFSMLLVYAIVYGLLSYSKLFGEKNSLHAIIALAAAVMVLVSPSLGAVIRIMTPWFAVLFIFLVMMLVFYRIMGAPENYFFDALKKNKEISTWIMIISFTVLASTLGYVYFGGTSDTSTQTVVHAEGGNVSLEVQGDVSGRGTGTVMATIFHPKVLGMIVLLLVGVFSVTLLASSGSKK